MKKEHDGKKILWIYDDIDHSSNPILSQAIETLTAKHNSVFLIDFADTRYEVNYEHIPLRKFSKVTKYILRNLKKFIKTDDINIFKISTRDNTRFFTFKDALLFLKAFTRSLLIAPNIVIFSKPTIGSVVALIISKLFRARLVYYPFELYGEQSFKVPEAWKNNEITLLKNHIDALITQNKMRAKVYEEQRLTKVIPQIVHNYKKFVKNDSKGKLHKFFYLSKKIKLVLYEGHLIQGRCLIQLIESVKFFPKNTVLVFIGKQSPWWEENVKSILKNSNFSKRIKILPWVSKENLYEMIPDANVGVIIYDDIKLNNKYCEPGKLSDYILCDVPVIAPDFPTISPIIKKLKIGNVFDSARPSDIANAIKKVLQKPKTHWSKYLKLAQKELVWETQVPQLLQAIFGE